MSKPSINPEHVLILGAGPGLSASVARRFGAEGYAITLVARSEQNLTALAQELRSDGITVDTATADAADSKGFRATLKDLADRITPGVVVYNAALITSDSILDIDEDYLLSSYAVNVVGAISAAQVFTPAMRKAKAGTFLATGGYAYIDPYPAYASLALGKAGLRAATTLLHKELKDDGVHATSITVHGPIVPDTALAPDLIAESYWTLHNQLAEAWTDEIHFTGQD
jgi:short-subunit dehydrogenase